ncbi:type III secretion protein HrpB4 [Paraburkholderia bannensis]|uniref:type III secretion protein HrpB4 n=1 Tax=Paraburkholderia bannensis TaxID=765414 RepID=UPI002AB75751|nr:type III secretion protein HrpB4 [Paraburkholderia bannensis]
MSGQSTMNAMSAMNAMSEAALVPVVAALRDYETRLRRLDVELRGVLPGLPSEAATQGAGYVWLRELLCPRRVAVDAFMRAGNRLGVLEPALLRRVLAVRALYAHRTAVRRCIDRNALAAMRAAVGEASLTALQRADARDGETALPLPPSLDSAALVREGLLRLRADGCIDDPGIWQLMSLHMAPDWPAADETVPACGADGARFLGRLPMLVPELPW